MSGSPLATRVAISGPLVPDTEPWPSAGEAEVDELTPPVAARALGYAASRVGPAPPPPAGLGPRVLLTIPVHNEARFIRTTLQALDLALAQSGIDYLLGVAEDGSTDGTKEILREVKREMPQLLLRMEDRKLGRGRALREFWADVPADFYAFCDTDLATDPETLVRLIRKAFAGSVVVVGSRYAAGAVVRRPLVRAWVSKVYNWYVQAAFRDGILDHQCGLKIFNRRVLEQILPQTQEDSWFWDTEILVRARRMGYAVDEVPVHWVERKTSRTSYRRLLSDVGLHGAGLLRLKGYLAEPAPRAARARPKKQESPAFRPA